MTNSELKKFELANIDEIKELGEKEEVNIIIPLPLESNVYILEILATLSKILKKLSGRTVKIEFLLMIDVTRESESIKDDLVKHNEDIMGKDLDKKLSSLIEIRTAEFKSLINSVLMSLEEVKMKDRVLNDVEYYDIMKYVEKKKIESGNFNAEEVYNSINELVEIEITTPYGQKKTVELSDIKKGIFLHGKDKEHYVFGELLKIINHYSLDNNDKNLIIIISDIMEGLIQIVQKEHRVFSEEIDFNLATKGIICVCYQDPSILFPHQEEKATFSVDAELEEDLDKSIIPKKLKDKFKAEGISLSDNASVTKGKENEWRIKDEEKFIVRKEEGKLNIYKTIPPIPPSYYTILSQYINNKSAEGFKKSMDELWYASMLEDYLRCSLFESKVIQNKEIIKNAEVYNKPLVSNADLYDNFRKDVYKKQNRPNYKKELIVDINTGFLEIQECILSQLELIL